jgi:hypothetical protein
MRLDLVFSDYYSVLRFPRSLNCARKRPNFLDPAPKEFVDYASCVLSV